MPPERLTTRLLHPHDPDPSTEDIFSSALETLFTDDTQQSHGVPGQSVIYRSPRFGDVYLQIPVHPDQDASRKLFAHYLWNAGVIAAEGIERASRDDDDDDTCDIGMEESGDEENGSGLSREMRWDKRFWDMRGLDVLELGAATALPSVISALSNARSVVSTDHPSSPAITMNAIESNLKTNVTNRGLAGVTGSAAAAAGARDTGDDNNNNNNNNDGSKSREYVNDKIPVLNHPPVHTETQTMVCGYTWGTGEVYNAREYGKLVDKQPDLESFNRIIIADCLWMSDQHENIVKTVLSYLKDDRQEEKSQDGDLPCAIVVAGFHTGREVVNNFVQIATGSGTTNGVGHENQQARLRVIEICEVDVDGHYRPWQATRPTETKEQSKRWCMCAILGRN